MAQPHSSGEDRFVATSLQLLNWAQRHTRTLVLGLGAVAILVFGVRYYFDYQHRVREAAAREMLGLRGQLQVRNADEVVELLRAFLIQYAGTSHGQEARVLLAEALLMANQAGAAIEPARQAINDLREDLLSIRAAFLLAAAHEEVGDTAAAIDVYQQVGESAQARLAKSRGLEGAARLRAARGELAAAAKIYERLAELTPEDAPARAFYETRAWELRASGVRAVEEAEEVALEGS